MDRRAAWRGIALAAAWIATSGCAVAPAVPASAPTARPWNEVATHRRIESILSQREWHESVESGPRPRPLTEQVNELLAAADGSLAAVLLEFAAIETERQEGRRRSVLNLARLLTGATGDPRTEVRGPCVRECRGVVYWDEMPDPGEFLDSYKTLETPGVLPEPPMWRIVGEFRREPFVPRPRELLEGISAEDSPEIRFLERGRCAGAGYQIGLLALRDERLRGALLAAALAKPKGRVARVVIAVAVATAGIREAEPVLRDWSDGAREADDLTDRDILVLGQAYELLGDDAESHGQVPR
jgi:hypothetical protein